MKDKLTDLTIYGLVGVGILTALEITQAAWEMDLIPKDLEQYVYGLTGAIGALILFLFLASFINELQGIKKNLEMKKSNNENN